MIEYSKSKKEPTTMRKLTVKRKWSIIECASRITLFVQCDEENATVAGNDGRFFVTMPLKNGKAVTVDISDDATTVFVESSTMQATYTVPAGTADVTLIAKPEYSPAEGNPFTFTEVK